MNALSLFVEFFDFAFFAGEWHVCGSGCFSINFCYAYLCVCVKIIWKAKTWHNQLHSIKMHHTIDYTNKLPFCQHLLFRMSTDATKDVSWNFENRSTDTYDWNFLTTHTVYRNWFVYIVTSTNQCSLQNIPL